MICYNGDMKLSATILDNGKVRHVKNLGWLLHHWKEVKAFSVDVAPSHCILLAEIANGSLYMIQWEDQYTLRNWLRRPVFFGIRVDWNGNEYVIEP
jgi:hypothetical protein